MRRLHLIDDIEDGRDVATCRMCGVLLIAERSPIADGPRATSLVEWWQASPTNCQKLPRPSKPMIPLSVEGERLKGAPI